MSSLLKESNLPSWGRVMNLGIQDCLFKDAFRMYMTPSRLEVAAIKNGKKKKWRSWQVWEEQLSCLIMSSPRWARALTVTLFKSARSWEQLSKVNNVTSRTRDFKVDLSELPCSLRAGCCQVSPRTFTSFKGRETLPATKALLPSLFYPRVDGFGRISFTISLLSCKHKIAPQLPFPKIQLFSCPVVAGWFPTLRPFCVFLSARAASHPEGHWSDALPATFSAFSCVRTTLTWPLTRV